MSLSGAHRAAFRREVSAEGRVYAIRDAEGYPAPADAGGDRRSVPFWSKPTRAQLVVKHVTAYQGFEVVPITIDDWLSNWMVSLEHDGMLVGVNWAGARATGYDLTPSQVLRWFAELECEPKLESTTELKGAIELEGAANPASEANEQENALIHTTRK